MHPKPKHDLPSELSNKKLGQMELNRYLCGSYDPRDAYNDSWNRGSICTKDFAKQLQINPSLIPILEAYNQDFKERTLRVIRWQDAADIFRSLIFNQVGLPIFSVSEKQTWLQATPLQVAQKFPDLSLYDNPKWLTPQMRFDYAIYNKERENSQPRLYATKVKKKVDQQISPDHNTLVSSITSSCLPEITKQQLIEGLNQIENKELSFNHLPFFNLLLSPDEQAFFCKEFHLNIAKRNLKLFQDQMNSHYKNLLILKDLLLKNLKQLKKFFSPLNSDLSKASILILDDLEAKIKNFSELASDESVQDKKLSDFLKTLVKNWINLSENISAWGIKSPEFNTTLEKVTSYYNPFRTLVEIHKDDLRDKAEYEESVRRIEEDETNLEPTYAIPSFEFLNTNTPDVEFTLSKEPVPGKVNLICQVGENKQGEAIFTRITGVYLGDENGSSRGLFSYWEGHWMNLPIHSSPVIPEHSNFEYLSHEIDEFYRKTANSGPLMYLTSNRPPEKTREINLDFNT